MTASTAPGLGWPTDGATGTARGLGWPPGPTDVTSPTGPTSMTTPTDPTAEEHA